MPGEAATALVEPAIQIAPATALVAATAPVTVATVPPVAAARQ